MSKGPILRVSTLAKRFGPAVALDGVSLEVAEGEVVCVIGPSGCGKSTLLRCINYLEEPDEGFVEIAGRHLGRVPGPGGVVRRQSSRELTALRPSVGMVFQQLHLWPHLTVTENVAKGPVSVLRQSREEALAHARRLVERFGLADKADEYPAALSGGQKQRVAIARALAMDPTLMLFDEPTSALDPELVGEVLAIIQELAAGGMTMVVVTHEIGFAARLADRIVFMDRGRIVEEGPAGPLLRSPRDHRLRAFLENVLSRPMAEPRERRSAAGRRRSRRGAQALVGKSPCPTLPARISSKRRPGDRSPAMLGLQLAAPRIFSMPDPTTLALFMAAVLALNLTPGPDMLFCFANGVARGRAAGAAAALGVGAGSLVHTTAAALGLAGLLLASPLAFDVVRYAGAAYLAFLAWKVFRAPPLAFEQQDGRAGASGLRRIFLNGAVTNVLNPKVALFFLAFLPQFVDPASGPVAVQVMILGTLIAVSGTSVNVAVGVSAGGLAGFLGRNPRLARAQQYLTGAIFAGLALRLAVAGGRSGGP